MALATLYRESLGLLTDLYQLTMAYGYWRHGLAEQEAVFHLNFRQHPFGGEFAIGCGLESVAEYLEAFSFSHSDLEYLRSLKGADHQPLFDDGFLEYLHQLRFTGNLDAIREGTAVFAHEPLLRVQGPLLQCQLLETPLLNLFNFQTLIATKAARIRLVAGDTSILEFGLRRAQGIDGGITASRSAYVGGCDATSNLMAGKLFGIPVRGTHAHSWVMVYDNERLAFERYAEAMPNNCVFLVDTFDTHHGVELAAEVGKALQADGHRLLGVRLDSGDLHNLSLDARRILDKAGCHDAKIVASNDLDEYQIEALRKAGARIDVWGVGTRLATAYDQPALGGVYKLSAIHTEDGWQDRIKLSEQTIKVSTPGIQQVRRYEHQGVFSGDLIFDTRDEAGGNSMVAFSGHTLAVPFGDRHHDLLIPVFRGGKRTLAPTSPSEARDRTLRQLQQLPPKTTQLKDPAPYLVGLEEKLAQRKQDLVTRLREVAT